MKHKDPASVIVVGAGVIGMMSALALADRGMSVTVLERGKLGRESSWAGGGILSSLKPWNCSTPVSALIQESAQNYPDLFASLERRSSVKIERLTPGMLFLNEINLTQATHWCASHAIEHKVLTPEHLVQTFALETNSPALYLPNIQSVRNPDLLTALQRTLENLPNVNIIPNQGAIQLIQTDRRIVGAKTQYQVIESDYTLVCAGAWSGELLATLGIAISVKPVKGQMLAYQGYPHQLKTIALSQGRYMIPRKDDLILVGSTLEEVGFDKTTTGQALSELTDFATRLLPSLADRPLAKHWAGLRPYSGQGPQVGKVLGVEGLYLNTGHYRNGIASAPASAKRIAQIIANQINQNSTPTYAEPQAHL